MKYFALLTEIGESLLANATALGTKLELTQMAVGDGDGKLPTPDPKQTKLVAEKRRGAINTLFVDEKNKNQIVVEQIIPETDGGWWIREIGLFDKSANLIAVANCPETYKPQLSEGSGRTQTIRMILIVSHTESVALKIDPSVVLATREYVDKAIEVQDKKINDIVNKKLDKTDVVQETGDQTNKVMSQKACTDVLAKKKSEESFYTGEIEIRRLLTDESRLSIIRASDYSRLVLETIDSNNTQYMGAFYERDANRYTLNTLYIPKKDGILALLSDVESLNNIPVGALIMWPQPTPPAGFLALNGQKFNPAKLTKLGAIWPNGVLPDHRSEFIRGLDAGRGVDPNRTILSAQGDAIRNMQGKIGYARQGGSSAPIANGEGVFRRDSNHNGNIGYGQGDDWASVMSFDASRAVPTANENRPRNIAYLYIVRAA